MKLSIAGEDLGVSTSAVSRAVGLLEEDLSLLMAATQDGRYVALLPDALVRRWDGKLRRLAVEPERRLQVFVSQRERLAIPTRADRVVDTLRRRVSRRRAAS